MAAEFQHPATDPRRVELPIHVRLPDRRLTVADVHPHVYGLHLTDGAKPWPYYRDAETGEWASLSCPSDRPVAAFAWLVPLVQLTYRPRKRAEDFLGTVYDDCVEAAEAFGGDAVLPCDLEEALDRAAAVKKAELSRDREAEAFVRLADGELASVADWWTACEAAGLTHGEGSLFWRLTQGGDDGFCVEPVGDVPVFNRLDYLGGATVPAVRLSFRILNVSDAAAAFADLLDAAESIAAAVGGAVVNGSGAPLDRTAALAALQEKRL